MKEHFNLNQYRKQVSGTIRLDITDGRLPAGVGMVDPIQQIQTEI